MSNIDQLEQYLAEGKLVLNVEELAQILGIGRNSAYTACTSGQIPSFRIGPLIRIPVAKLKKMLEETPFVTPPEPEPAPPRAVLAKPHQIPKAGIQTRVCTETFNRLVEVANSEGKKLGHIVARILDEWAAKQ